MDKEGQKVNEGDRQHLAQNKSTRQKICKKYF